MTIIGLRPHSGSAMLKTFACFGLAVAIAAPTAAHAVSGASSSYGSYGTGPTIPTQALTPFDRAWNEGNEAQNEAIYEFRMAQETHWANRHFPGSHASQSAAKGKSSTISPASLTTLLHMMSEAGAGEVLVTPGVTDLVARASLPVPSPSAKAPTSPD